MIVKKLATNPTTAINANKAAMSEFAEDVA